jgi:hypothetical protein
MRQVGKIVVTALVLTLAQGCAEKKAKVKVAPQAQAPVTDQAGALYPPPFPEKTEAPPVVPEPTKPDVVPAPKPAPQKKPPAKKKSTPSTSTTAKASKPAAGKPAASVSDVPVSTPAAAPAAVSDVPTTEQAANVEPSVVSPIGQLSSGDGGSGSQKRRETSELINNTEQGLNNIKRTLSPSEQETAAQIRVYLKQAKKALTVDDLDGASTLATKAKVLLEELTKP